jgi:formylglycine-generating enzyme required for sulfatase activity
MSDPAESTKPKGWPLAAISLLVALLAGFLFVRWSKKDDIPAIVKEAPPAPTPPPTPDPSKDPGVAPPPVAPTPASAEFDARLKELRAAIDAKKWDDAAAALQTARKLRADAPELKGLEDAIAEGRKKEEAERAETVRKADLKRKQEREWGALKEKVEKQREQNLWDAALAALEKFSQEYPDVVRDSDYERTKGSVLGLQKECDGYFKQHLATAEKHYAEKRFGQAIASAESAIKLYPERQPVVREFQGRVREAQSVTTMVRIPSTACWVGGEGLDEKPVRQVKLPAFLLDKYEVTNEDFLGFVTATNREPPAYWDRGRPPKGRERHPVVFITYADAEAYASWAGKRLPTAEEWEVAARGPDKREFPWGNVFLEKEDRIPCNCLEYWQVNKSLSPGTTPVDDKAFDNGESAFGVYGMGGNVWEWTSTAAPAKGTRPPGEFRILKGGSFMTPQKSTRCANIYAEDPRLPHPDVGFRCARDIK